MLCEKYFTLSQNLRWEPSRGDGVAGFWTTKACWTKYSYWSTADRVKTWSDSQFLRNRHTFTFEIACAWTWLEDWDHFSGGWWYGSFGSLSKLQLFSGREIHRFQHYAQLEVLCSAVQTISRHLSSEWISGSCRPVSVFLGLRVGQRCAEPSAAGKMVKPLCL